MNFVVNNWIYKIKVISTYKNCILTKGKYLNKARFPPVKASGTTDMTSHYDSGPTLNASTLFGSTNNDTKFFGLLSYILQHRCLEFRSIIPGLR